MRALIHGLSSPEEILARPGLSPRLVELLTPLVGGRDESLDFKKSYEALYEKPDFEQLVISHRIDLSELELAYLFKLAELGVKIRFEFPIDDSGQGFSLPVTYLLQRIEKRHDLKNLEVVLKPFSRPSRVVRYEAPDLVQEARLVAQAVAGFGPNKTVAVTLRVLDKRALIFEDALKAHGLETPVVALPDLLGKTYDCVVVADCAHGRLTLSREPDWELRDLDCFEINRLMGRQILRRFEEDPLEPSLFPARQAFEPMWFLGAASAASELLILTNSTQDENGQAQTQSQLVQLDWLGPGESINSLELPLSPLEQIFEEAKIKPPEFERKDLFVMDKARFRGRFGDLLGFNSEQPLSATRIEAFAKCPFRAFVEKLLRLDFTPARGSDIEPRVLGQLAHVVLEKYYASGESIAQAFGDESGRVLKENPGVHEGVWNAMMIWLQGALERLVSNLDKNPPVLGAVPVAFEKKLGPMPMQIGADEIFLGGVADRIDQSSDALMVIDYKLSSLSSLRMRFAPKEILKTHFQIPIYLKLFSPLFKKGGQGGFKFFGVPISIKDGAPGPILDLTDCMDELDQALVSLLEPVLNGYVPAEQEGSCSDCKLRRVCREGSKQN